MTTRSSWRRRFESADEAWADQWFAALDQRRFGSGAESWVAQVLGIHSDGERLWVEVAPVDDPTTAVVLRVSAETTVDRGIAALEGRPIGGESRPAIIDVLPLA